MTYERNGVAYDDSVWTGPPEPSDHLVFGEYWVRPLPDTFWPAPHLVAVYDRGVKVHRLAYGSVTWRVSVTPASTSCPGHSVYIKFRDAASAANLAKALSSEAAAVVLVGGG